jgi:hypothetical protein
MTTFETAMARWATLDEDALARPWSWRDQPMDVRYALYRTIEDAQEAVVRVASGRHPESQLILAQAQRAFGDLRGLLVGLPDDVLDAAPRAGEWPVRDTLRHVLWVERRYALQTLHAIERAAGDPVRIPDARLPALDLIDVSGDVAAVLARIGDARADTNRRLGDLAPAAMTRPTVWAGHDIDVRFRLHRFATHVAEHTIQCEKTLDALGWRATEGRRIVRRLWALVGELEGLGATEELRGLDATVAERAATAS